MEQRWCQTWKADPNAVALADRHYTRQHVGSPQFVPPGKAVILITENADCLWVTSQPYAQYVRHAWAGAWVNSLFRNESDWLSSEAITTAVATTLAISGAAPKLGIVSFIDTRKVRKKRDFGRCYRRAGWYVAGETKGGLLCLQLLPHDMPEPLPPLRKYERI